MSETPVHQRREGREDSATPTEKLQALRQVFVAQPILLGGMAVLSIATALFSGVGLAFLLPITEFVQQPGGSPQSQYLQYFQYVYDSTGIPFTLEYIIAGAILVTSVEYLLRGINRWLREYIRTGYLGDLRTAVMENILSAEVAYIDERGSDEALNVIVTESERSQQVITGLIRVMGQAGLIVIYVLLALLISPRMTIVGVGLLVIIAVSSRQVVDPAYAAGDRIRDANQRIQSSAQAALHGLKDIKIFNYKSTILDRFTTGVDKFTATNLGFQQNQVLLRNAYDYITLVIVFGVVYYGIRFADLSLGLLAVFAVAIIRLAPSIRDLNNMLYHVDGVLPHLIQVQSFIDDLSAHQEPTGGRSPPEKIRQLYFEDISFTYKSSQVLDGVSFTIERGDHVSFVGGSGEGKSTIASLLAGFYRPDSGEILIDGHPIRDFDLDQWRSRLSVVRQRPFLFDDTIRNNIVLQQQAADDGTFERACATAMVDEFIDEMPAGYETEIGENGVRLSGGQRQRVAIARALYKDHDVLVLDEATSELDYDIRTQIEAGVAEWHRDRFLVVIGHQLSAVERSDTIYLLSDGVITERGTPEELKTHSEEYNVLFQQ